MLYFLIQMKTFDFIQSFLFLLQVCREFQRGTCSRAMSECRYAHPADHIVVDATDNHVTVCMDFIKSKCTRDLCKYFHPPSHLQALVRAAHARNQAATVISNNSSSNSSALVGCMRECATIQYVIFSQTSLGTMTYLPLFCTE